MTPIFDKLIELPKARQENREKLFSGFVEFDAAHSDYLACFQKYRNLIVRNSHLTHADIQELQDLLRTDSRFHRHIKRSAIAEADVLRESNRCQ